jgi:hypothetical protein
VADAVAETPIVIEAQAQLVRLHHADATVADYEFIPPAVDGRHYSTSIEVPAGGAVESSLLIRGNATFRVVDAEVDADWVAVSVKRDDLGHDAVGAYRVYLDVQAPAEAGDHAHVLRLVTNDACNPMLDVAVHISVTAPVRVTPGVLFFGRAAPGQACRASVRLSASAPFGVGAVVDATGHGLRVAPTRVRETEWVLDARLQSPNHRGVLEGELHVTTTAAGQPQVTIPYYCEVHTVAP